MSVDVSSLEARVREHARERAERIGDSFVERLQGNMPYRSGEMQRSVTVDSIDEGVGGVTVRIVVGAPHAVFQNYGTGIYGPDGVPITPVRANVLAFDWPAAGGMVFRHSVAGTEPQHFWERTLDEWPSILAAA